ncbi:MAG: glycosyltransferase family 9 protein [bacterium]|nr:glycosyltransferase family 9 protein [bacterium]
MNTEKLKNFLLVRTDNIGDVILSVPVSREIKRNYSDSKITLLCRNHTRILGERYPYIDSIISVENDNGEERSFDEITGIIKNEGFDCGILIHPTFKLARLLVSCGIPVRIGTGYRFYSFLLNKRHYEHRKESVKHEAEYNLGLLNAINIEPGTPELHFDITEEEIRIAEEELNEAGIGIGRKFCVIHPGSRGSAMDWSLESFAETADLLIEKHDYEVLITWGKGEEEIPERVRKAAKQELRTLRNVLPLPVLAGILKKAEFTLAPSTGILHLANAVGSRMIGLYPPVPHMSPVRWGPYGHISSTLVPDIDQCEHCKDSKCRQIDCMKLITPGIVLEKYDAIITNDRIKKPKE